MEAALEDVGLSMKSYQRKKPVKAFIKVGRSPDWKFASVQQRNEDSMVAAKQRWMHFAHPPLPRPSCAHAPLPHPCLCPLPLQRGVGTAAGIARGFKKDIEDAAARRKRQEQLTKQ